MLALESAWDAARLRRAGTRVPSDFRIEAYLGHGGPRGVVVRGRVLDDAPPDEAVEGEGVRPALRRMLRQFVTDELPGVPLRVTVAGASVDVETDAEGYFLARLHPEPGALTSPWSLGTVQLAGDYRGTTGPHTTPFDVRVPEPDARFGVISDVDDTILETGVQRVGHMIRQTLTGSAITRTAFTGAPELYRDLAAGGNPLFYVSSSPWNLHAFLVAFLLHRDFPLGPVLLRDLLGSRTAGREPKHVRIHEILDLHPDLPFGSSATRARRTPRSTPTSSGRVPTGCSPSTSARYASTRYGRVEQVTDAWDQEVPFVLAADSDAVRRHAVGLGLLTGPA